MKEYPLLYNYDPKEMIGSIKIDKRIENLLTATPRLFELGITMQITESKRKLLSISIVPIIVTSNTEKREKEDKNDKYLL